MNRLASTAVSSRALMVADAMACVGGCSGFDGPRTCTDAAAGSGEFGVVVVVGASDRAGDATLPMVEVYDCQAAPVRVRVAALDGVEGAGVGVGVGVGIGVGGGIGGREGIAQVRIVRRGFHHHQLLGLGSRR